MANKQREFDLVVWGATGFTGMLVAEYLSRRHGSTGDLHWATAGRSADKLSSVHGQLGLATDTPSIVADADDVKSLQSLVGRTRVIISTVGPYQRYGSELVAACAKSGTDYVDLCGEPGWMHDMINAHEEDAKASGARLVFSCGFDSVPFDLGVFYLQQLALERTGKPAQRVRGRVRNMRGTFSGGTAASFRATVQAATANPSLGKLLINPFALTPTGGGPKQPSGMKPHFDEAVGSWVAPFVMAVINTKNIHRSNALLGYRYGRDFVYDEMLMTGTGEIGEQRALAMAKDNSIAESDRKPGEGPSQAERESGFFDVVFIGDTYDGDTVRVSVRGDRDPGYGSTSKMIAEAALCLLDHHDQPSGGFWTPAPAFGDRLISRLQDNAGVTFHIEADP
ncbi:MAG: saccharopine dehydrogenase NADP-binding domain-containing protein [Pseudomonadota bacterium]